VLLLTLGCTSSQAEAPAAEAVLTLKIDDAASGLSVVARKPFEQGTEALAAIEQLVAIEYQQRGGGVFVTRLCGVEPAGGQFWALYVDGQFAKVGIGSIRLDGDTQIHWKTQ